VSQYKSIAEPVGFIEKIKAGLNIDTLLEQFRSSKQRIIECGIYLAVGFFIGLLCKRYAHYMIICVIFISGIIALSHVGILEITIQWDILYKFTGIQTATLQGDPVGCCYQWIRLNIVQLLTFFIGFFLGLKVA
jgi:uncharacterized membrane protein (Fun14 family)